MINLDMIGRAKEDTANIGGGSMCPEFEKICRECADAAGIKPRLGAAPGGGSDHVSFFNKNVPSVFIISSSNPEYHTPGDTLDKINFPTMTRVAKMTYLIANDFANLKEMPEIDIEALRQRQRRERGRRGPYFGFHLEDTDKGVEITEVTENSPAQEAGLKPHDIILKVKGTELKTRRDLYGALRGLKVGEEIEIEVLRSGEKQTIELTVGRRPSRR
jgi:membrane-associated protease RseP (regulator of RpoE activity)